MMKIENTESLSGAIFFATLLFSISILSLVSYILSWNLTFPEGYWTTQNQPPSPGYCAISALVIVPFSISFAIFNSTFLVQIMNYLFDRTICDTCQCQLEKFGK